MFRSQSDDGDGLTIVDGRPSAASGEPIGVQEPDADGAFPGPRPRIEIAVSVEAAEAVGVGDSLDVAADQEDELVPDRLSRPIEAEAVIVGTYVVDDPRRTHGSVTTGSASARIGGTAERPVAFATGLVASDALADIAASGLPFRMEWRYFVEPARAEADAVEALSHDLRRMATEYASLPSAARNPGALVLRTGLLPLLEGYHARRAASEAVLSIAASAARAGTRRDRHARTAARGATPPGAPVDPGSGRHRSGDPGGRRRGSRIVAGTAARPATFVAITSDPRATERLGVPLPLRGWHGDRRRCCSWRQRRRRPAVSGPPSATSRPDPDLASSHGPRGSRRSAWHSLASCSSSVAA